MKPNQKNQKTVMLSTRGVSASDLIVIVFLVACIATLGFAGFYYAAHKAGGIVPYWTNLPFYMKYFIYVPTFILLVGSLIFGLVLIAFLYSGFEPKSGTSIPDAETGEEINSLKETTEENSLRSDTSED